MSPEYFIQKAKNSSEISGFRVHKSNDSFWDYYYQLVGFLNGKYFSITFKSKNKNENISIALTTEGVENFKKYFNL